jgi:NAD(P) transhydrogenase
VVVGAGVIGIEYASIFAALGSKVTVVERRDRILEFCDEEVVQALQYHLRALHVTFRPRETVSEVQVHNG